MRSKLNVLRAAFSILGFGFYLLPCLGAQDSLSDTESVLPASFHNDAKCVEECIHALGSIYKGIDSMGYVYERNKPGDIVYEKFVWREQTSGKYYYQLTSIRAGKGGFDMERSALFDGKRTYSFDPLDHYVSIRNGESNLSVCRAYDSPLLPFRFLQNGDAPITLRSLLPGSPELTFLQKRALCLGEQTYKGIDCRVLRVPGLQDPELKETVDFDVFLDKARGLFPIGWREFDRDRVPIRSMFAVQLNTLNGKNPGARFPYPAKYVMWISRFSGTISVNGKVVKYFPDESTGTFDKVSIDLDDSEFSFDPSTANTIYDEDAKTIIPVPK